MVEMILMMVYGLVSLATVMVSGRQHAVKNAREGICSRNEYRRHETCERKHGSDCWVLGMPKMQPEDVAVSLLYGIIWPVGLAVTMMALYAQRPLAANQVTQEMIDARVETLHKELGWRQD